MCGCVSRSWPTVDPIGWDEDCFVLVLLSSSAMLGGGKLVVSLHAANSSERTRLVRLSSVM